MAAEAKRGCGYRKVGGLYMVSGKLSAPCGRLPLELHVCPVCNAGIKQTRAWQWIKPRQLLADAPACREEPTAPHRRSYCDQCPLAPYNLPETAGLLWIGEKFYRTADAFMAEANALGVSRRIPAVPRNFKLGESWVLIAHPKAIEREPRTPDEIQELREANTVRANAGEAQRLFIMRGGVITMFKPTAVEKIVTDLEAKDEAAMAALREKGITPVVVPHDDPDHRGSVHDDDEETYKPQRNRSGQEIQTREGT